MRDSFFPLFAVEDSLDLTTDRATTRKFGLVVINVLKLRARMPFTAVSANELLAFLGNLLSLCRCRAMKAKTLRLSDGCRALSRGLEPVYGAVCHVNDYTK